MRRRSRCGRDREAGSGQRVEARASSGAYTRRSKATTNVSPFNGGAAGDEVGNARNGSLKWSGAPAGRQHHSARNEMGGLSAACRASACGESGARWHGMGVGAPVARRPHVRTHPVSPPRQLGRHAQPGIGQSPPSEKTR